MYRVAASRLLQGSRFTLQSSSRLQHAKSQLNKTTNYGSSRSTSRSFTTSSAKSNPSFVEWYEGHLQARPVITKMITGSFLWGVGDVVAQVVPQLSSNNKEDTSSNFSYDMPRTSRAVIFGFAIHAPASHVHFNFLEWLTNRVGVKGLGIPIFKTFMEQVSAMRAF